MIVGITGGIATGKSTVVQRLRAYGAHVIDADEIARAVVAVGTPTLARIVATFGKVILCADGSLDRRALGQRVFEDHAERQTLESIVHPPIRQCMLAKIAAVRHLSLVVVDIPLLFENGWHESGLFDVIVVVYVPSDVQHARLRQRDHISVAYATQKIASQWSIEQKKTIADVIIDNSGTIEQTFVKVDAFVQQVQS